MSDVASRKSESACAHVRQAECEALKKLSPAACKAWLAIRYGRAEAAAFELGIRDFEEWGLKRTVAARALREIVAAGLLKMTKDATFGSKRTRRTFEFVHRRGAEIQTAQAVTAIGYRPRRRSPEGLTDREGGHRDAIQTAQAVILKDASSPSAQKPKGEEASGTPPPAPPPMMGGAGPAGEPGGRERLREQQRRIERAALALAMTSHAFMIRAGGPKAADFLARRFEGGSVTPLQLAAHLAVLADSGFGKGAEDGARVEALAGCGTVAVGGRQAIARAGAAIEPRRIGAAA